MTTRQQKNRLRLATWGLALPTIAIVTWAVFWPIASEYSQPAESLQAKLGSPNMTVAKEPLDRQVVETNWNRTLRSWNAEAPPVAVPPSASLQAKSAAGLRLVGTVLEPGATFAMIADQSGTIDLQPVGGILAIEPRGVRVERISARSVVINYRGVSETLSLVSMLDTSDQESASDQVGESPTTEMNSESIAPKNLDDELDWLNGEPPMQASPPRTNATSEGK